MGDSSEFRLVATRRTRDGIARWRRERNLPDRVARHRRYGQSDVAGLASRETFVGLQGPWGTFWAGKFFVPYDDVHLVFGSAPTYGTAIFATSATWGQGAQNTFSGAFDARQGNSLRWDSPDWSGFAVSTQLSLRDSSGFPDNVGPSANPANPILGGDNGDHASELRHGYVVGVAASTTRALSR
jgi:predicted porin